VTDFADSVIDRLERAYAESTGSEGVETVDLEAETNVILKLLRTSGEFIIEFFLADSLDMEVPQFHEEIWGLLTDQEKERVLLAIPRGHAKTTLAKLCVIWYWLFTSHRFCVYLSNTAAIAKGACRDIIEWLSHPNFIQIFGVISTRTTRVSGFLICRRAMAESNGVFCARSGKGSRCAESTSTTNGLTWQLSMTSRTTTIRHPRLSRRSWISGCTVRSSKRWRRSARCSGSGICSRKRVCYRGKAGILRGIQSCSGVSSRDPTDSYVRYGPSGGRSSNSWSHSGFTADQLHYAPAPDPSEIRAAWITIDPAFGLKAHNDESSIAVHVIPRGSNIPVTLTPVHGRWTETQLYHRTLEIAAYWNAWTWGIEAVAAQKVLLTLFDMLQTVVGLPGRAVFVPLTAGRGDPKIARIRAFVSLLADKKWAIAEDDVDLTTQILGLDLRKKDQEDDIADSAAYGPSMWEEFQGLIEHQFAANDDDPCEAEYGTEVAGV
jgi:hypothetical protein